MKRLFILFYFGNIVTACGFWVYSAFFINLGSFIYALGRLFGLVGAIMILIQLMLIGRAKWFEGRYGFDSLAKLHQINGRLAIPLLVLHPIFLSIGKGGFDVLLGFYPIIILPLIGLIIIILIVIISNPLIMRLMKYESWYYIHLFVYLVLPLVLLHPFLISSDFASVPAFLVYWIGLHIFVFANFIYFRILRPLLLYKKHQFVVERVAPETHDTVSLYISGKKMSQFRFLPGQFLLLRFLMKGLKWQVHPYSISALPDDTYVRVTVKALGDYSRQLTHIISGINVIIDGPYGKFTAATSVRDKILFIAAGSGITPIRPIIEQLIARGKDIILLYSNKTTNDVIFREELESLTRQYPLKIHYFFTRETQIPRGAFAGRIATPRIQEIVPDLFDREIFLCGPIEMTKTLRIDLATLGFDSAFLYYERFNW